MKDIVARSMEEPRDEGSSVDQHIYHEAQQGNSMPTNQAIAELFENMAALLEMKGDTIFKIRAYQRAARTIDQLPLSLEQAVKDGMELKSIPGIGDAISKKIHDLVTIGRVETYERLKSELPDGVLTLMNVPGIGPRTAMLVAKELGATTIEGVEKTALDGSLAALPNMGEKTAQNILRHIRSLRTKDQRMPIGQALPVAERVISALRDQCPDLGEMSPVGSLRRWKETVGEIDIMGTGRNPAQVMDALVGLPVVQAVLGHGQKKSRVVVDPGLQIDLRMIEADSFGAMLQYFTGSQQHNIRLRDYANRGGLSLNEYGITPLETGKLEKYAQEEDFYARLGLPWIPPEIREGLWELDLAERHELPELVRLSDITGDLHVHSDWSDGRDSLERMVEAAVHRGYRYVAFTDHSAGRGIANGLSQERLLHQIEILHSIGEHYPIKILCGSEVDIRADGSLDYPDELLEKLDVVVASVHSAMGQDSTKMTQRVIKAMHNPHVTVIGHPSCRLLGSRDPVDVDMDALFRAALETGTAMEINGAPERLDLKDTHVFQAKEMGVPLILSTDSHSHTNLDNMRFGIAVARRGSCESKHIVNTLPIEKFLAFIAMPKPQRLSLFARGA